MLIDLSDILSVDGKTKELKMPVSMDSFESKLGSFPIVEKQPLDVVITNTGKKVLRIEVKGKVSLALPCDRCLKDVATEFEIDLEKEVDMKTSEEDRIKDLDEINYITGCSLDIEQLVHNEILIHWPMRVLCKEDCKGICSHCGKDLNEGPCSCEQESPDPRMAAIRDIFSKFKEV